MAKRRGNNEGSLFQRKDGRWVAQATVQGQPVSKYFKTQKEGREWLKNILAQVDEGLTFLGTQTSVSAYLEEWLKVIPMTVRPKTATQYAQIVHQHICPSLGKTKLKDLRPDMIQSLYNAKLSDGIGARTVSLIHAVLHKALNYALKMGMIVRNPADAVTKPKSRRAEMHTLDDTQARNFLLAAQESRLYALYHVAISTGLRIGELLGLKWSDLDWTTHKISVQRQLQRLTGKGLVFSEPKTRAGRRVIVLGKSTINVLHEHFDDQFEERKQADKEWNKLDLIFVSSEGTPLDQRNVTRDYKEILKKAGCPEIRFHDLRHTAASLMLQQNVHPKVVQERLGHSDISLTLNTYSHVMPGMQEEAASKMDELLTLVDVKDELESSKKKEKVGKPETIKGG